MQSLREEIREASRTWSTLTIYGRFEQLIVLFLNVLIAIVVLSPTWHLATIVVDVDVIMAEELLALAAAILALGIVHWLVRDQDRRQESPGGR